MENKGITLRKIAVNSEVTKNALYQYLRGAPTMGLVALERIFRYLGFNITDENGKFYYYGYDIRKAICRRIKEKKILIKDICAAAQMSQPCITDFFAERSVVRPAKAELMLSYLQLSVGEIAVPDRLPRLKAERKKKYDFAIGNAIKAALDKKGITMYRFCVDNNINTGGFSVFLNTGTQIGSELFEKIISKLDMTITDGTEVYGDIRTAIKHIMINKNISAYRICKETGCSCSSMSFFMNNKKNIGINKLVKILSFLKIDIK